MFLGALLTLVVAGLISLNFWIAQRRHKKKQHSPQASEASLSKRKPDSQYRSNPAYRYMASGNNGSEENLAAMKEKDTAIANPAFGEDMNINEDSAADHNTVPQVTVTDEIEVPATNEDMKETPLSTHSAKEAVNESSSVHDDNDTVPLVTVVEVPATEENLKAAKKETPSSTRSAKEKTPSSTRSAKEKTPSSTLSAKEETPSSTRSAKEKTPSSTRSAKEKKKDEAEESDNEKEDDYNEPKTAVTLI